MEPLNKKDMKTAVEWLEKELNYIEENAYTSYIDLKIQQALAMEKEQIENAFNYGQFDLGMEADEYYNLIYKSE
jgi:hypothetical protein